MRMLLFYKINSNLLEKKDNFAVHFKKTLIRSAQSVNMNIIIKAVMIKTISIARNKN